MTNILKKYTKEGPVTIGDDNLELDTPTFEIIGIHIDPITKILKVEILHQVTQGTVVQKHSREISVDFNKLPASVKTAGKGFLNSIEAEILKLPTYSGSNEQ